MSIKEKKVEVKTDEGQKINIVVKRPSSRQLERAQMVGSKVWTQAVKDGIFTKVGLEKFMEAQGIWTSEKAIEQTRILQEIALLESQIATGKNENGTTLRLSEGKEKAIQLRKLRIGLRELISEKISLESNTAEGLADNAKFNYLVSQCTYDETGENKVYANVEDYNDRSDDEISFNAAAALGELVYKLDRSYEESLPENQFLKKYKFVDSELSLVDEDGNRVDVDGTKVNDKGWLVNDKGDRVDREGNLLTEEGNLLVRGEFIDDIHPESKPKAKTAAKKVTKKQTSKEQAKD
tara:strand:- start:8508 stop:9389 length:882 start_codon:yes stop_codon:yes gene_type:complete